MAATGDRGPTDIDGGSQPKNQSEKRTRMLLLSSFALTAKDPSDIEVRKLDRLVTAH